MRRSIPTSLRLGFSTPWVFNAPVSQVYFSTRFLARFDDHFFRRLNNLRRTNFLQFTANSYFVDRFWKKADRRWLLVFYRYKRRRFLPRRTVRVVNCSFQLRRRVFLLPAIIFSRRRVAPFWGGTKWYRRIVRRFYRPSRGGYHRTKRWLHRFYTRRHKALRHIRRSYLDVCVRKFLRGKVFSLYPSISLRNVQTIFFSRSPEIRGLYFSSLYRKLAKQRRRSFHTFSFMSVVLSAAFRWRNAFLMVSTIGFEMRRTRFHFRFVKVFSRFLGVFMGSRYSFLNLVIRVRGCFGKADRTRVFFMRPSFKRNNPAAYQNFSAPVTFSFRHVLTYRGVFGMALWLA
jgi:hypothetical protein